MLIHPTIDKLEALGLAGMAAGPHDQMEGVHYLEISFEDRFGMLVDCETDRPHSHRLSTRLKAANLRHAACVEDIDLRAPVNPRRRPLASARRSE